MFILKKHLNNCSPWVALSRCGDSNERFGPGDDDRFSDPEVSDDDDVEDAADARRNPAGGRPRRFIIDDAPDAGPAVFVAQKGVKIRGQASHCAMFAVAVREDGDEKGTAVHRFVFALPGMDIRDMTKWIAVPRPGGYNTSLFSGVNHDKTAAYKTHVSPTSIVNSLLSN